MRGVPMYSRGSNPVGPKLLTFQSIFDAKSLGRSGSRVWLVGERGASLSKCSGQRLARRRNEELLSQNGREFTRVINTHQEEVSATRSSWAPHDLVTLLFKLLLVDFFFAPLATESIRQDSLSLLLAAIFNCCPPSAAILT